MGFFVAGLARLLDNGWGSGEPLLSPPKSVGSSPSTRLQLWWRVGDPRINPCMLRHPPATPYSPVQPHRSKCKTACRPTGSVYPKHMIMRHGGRRMDDRGQCG
jgi:hypothetical protein